MVSVSIKFQVLSYMINMIIIYSQKKAEYTEGNQGKASLSHCPET